MPAKVRKKNENENFFRSRFRFPTIFCFYTPSTRHHSTLILPLCRQSRPVSQQLQAKVQQIFLHLPKPPYLCTRKKLINSINIKIIRIMTQKNEMSARALTMEEMENVNGGIKGWSWQYRREQQGKLSNDQSVLELISRTFFCLLPPAHYYLFWNCNTATTADNAGFDVYSPTTKNTDNVGESSKVNRPSASGYNVRTVPSALFQSESFGGASNRRKRMLTASFSLLAR